MIARALNALGLMRVSEHEALLHHKILNPVEPETDWEAKFKLAATDLAKQAEEIAELKVRLHYAEPRAIKWDNSLKRSRDRKAAKNRGGGK